MIFLKVISLKTIFYLHIFNIVFNEIQAIKY
jgi:hypothetical protein